MRIGVLAVQGDVREHAAMLRRLGAEVVEVRKPEHLRGLDGLVVPGGESTTITRLMQLYGLWDELRSFERPLFGTCAGMIVLARDAVDAASGQEFLGRADVVVRRNAFGRQTASFEADFELQGETRPLHGVFIRAPTVSEVGPGAEVLARDPDGSPVAVRQGRVLATAFHPELTGDRRLHRLLVEMIGRGAETSV